MAQAPKADNKPIDTRAECAKVAGVGEHTYSAGKAILDAVAVGTLPAQVVTDINDGKPSSHGMAKGLQRTTTAKRRLTCEQDDAGQQVAA